MEGERPVSKKAIALLPVKDDKNLNEVEPAGFSD